MKPPSFVMEVSYGVFSATINPRYKKKFSDSRFLITALWVGSAAGVNGPVIFMEN